MSSIVIALPKIEDAKKIRAVCSGTDLPLHLYVQPHQCSVKCFRTWKRRTDLQVIGFRI